MTTVVIPRIAGAVAYDSTSVGITGGSITGVTGVTSPLNGGGLPFISLSSGSVAAGGAISAITALPRIYPAAYCYFPANILATSGAGSAAGFYYCTFSSTTAGTAFLNAYTSGAATVPTSPTAVTNGQGAFTGDTGEEFGLTLTVPALRAQSAIHILQLMEQTNNANAKTYRVRMSGTGGTIFVQTAAASVSAAANDNAILNAGATNSQFSVQYGSLTNPSVQILGTVDTSVATTMVFSLQKATATDNMVLCAPIVELLP